ncbi:ABC transporter permease [Winogradskya humida]|uniref:ABC3 transporter permease C-terminal domain-containing protein n=1 Tax=Winogradskya humida TaxID=113566 RepID=A0ABQ3ZXC6_9ACTN|nr:ABC transporter permease [Actinoplanes humidus]GIE23280.1 hypothetical protein Ahu01nite_063820 [Actinoplanes humidus]
MSLVVRRAGAARSLLAAAGGLALIATLLLTGLVAYSREVVGAGVNATLDAAAPQESSVLVRGSAGKTTSDLGTRDRAVRERLGAALGGRPVTVYSAGYAAGRALSGNTGDAVPDSGGIVYASVMFLQGLPEHAVLSGGAWPEPGASPVQTAVGEGAARILGLAAGDRVPVTDRVSGKVTTLVVSGVWRPRDARDPFWQLAPDVSGGVAPSSATYGPLVVDRADFDHGFARNASAAWLADVQLAGGGVAGARQAATAIDAERAELPAATGLGSSASVQSSLGDLAGRLTRADLVGRSALVTPILLISVLSGLALVLVAVLLTESRRSESALLRARGATSWQLAGLTAGEAVAVVLPAVLVSPPLAAAAVHLAGTRGWFGLSEPAGWQAYPGLWLVALVAGAGCALAITVPVLRGGTYTEDMVAQSRPTRRGVIQRAGADLLLLIVAVLGWLQLRQYSSPLSSGVGGSLGIDPLLAAAPTLGILAGAVLALRLLAPAARLAERLLGRGERFAPLFGMWQAGRRPHAGPVLLLALAVAAGTVGWCLAGTAGRSVTDQADHGVGADLRLEEISGTAPPSRAGKLAALPGVAAVLPAWRETVQSSADDGAVELIALDAAAARGTLRVRSDLYDGGAGALSATLTAARSTPPLVDLPAGKRLNGTLSITGGLGVPSLSAVVLDASGAQSTVALTSGKFSAALPAASGLRLAGFIADTDAFYGLSLEFELSGLAVDATPVAPDDGWTAVGRIPSVGRSEVTATSFRLGVSAADSGRTKFAIVRPLLARPEPVPVVATPDAQRRLRLSGDGPATLRIAGADVPVRLAGSIVAVPGSEQGAAMLVDLPSLQAYLLHKAGLVHQTQEWWLGVAAGSHDETAAGAAGLGGLRVLDRRAIASASATDAYGVGGRTALFAAALGALLLAAAGILVDVRTTTRRRINELAVLHTLGAGPRTLARSLMTEQAFLAGIGVLAGLVVGIGVAAAMAPLLILTPQGARPVPPPFLVVDWWRAGGTAALLLLLALGLSALAGSTLRRRLAATRMHLGADR